MDDHTERIRELFLRARDLEQEAEAFREAARRLIREMLASVSPEG